MLTAVEDFVAERDGLRLAIVPAFFGLGVVWSPDAPYADALAELLEPWDRNPLLERLETNRVFHLAESHVQTHPAAQWKQRAGAAGRAARLLDSRAFALAERCRACATAPASPEQSVVSKDEIRRVLED